MTRTLQRSDLRASAHERDKIKARAQQPIAEEMSLQDLRKAIGKTQTAIAKRLKVGQDAVSKLGRHAATCSPRSIRNHRDGVDLDQVVRRHHLGDLDHGGGRQRRLEIFAAHFVNRLECSMLRT